MRSGVAKDTRDSRGLWCRYEMKYLISESKAAAITEFIRPYVRLDRYCKLRPNGTYPIVSLYLDSKNLRLCQESLQGQKSRFKLRIRSYTDELDYPRFVEIKRRVNAIIIKDRARIKHCNIASLLSGLYLPPHDYSTAQETLKQFQLYMNRICARPVVRTRYQRQAFEGISDDRMRITFDRDVSYSVTSDPNVGLNGQGWHTLPLNSVVLEIKFTGHYSAWLGSVVKCFGLRQQSLSKYVYSIKQASLSGFLFA